MHQYWINENEDIVARPESPFNGPTMYKENVESFFGNAFVWKFLSGESTEYMPTSHNKTHNIVIYIDL